MGPLPTPVVPSPQRCPDEEDREGRSDLLVQLLLQHLPRRSPQNNGDRDIPKGQEASDGYPENGVGVAFWPVSCSLPEGHSMRLWFCHCPGLPVTPLCPSPTGHWRGQGGKGWKEGLGSSDLRTPPSCWLAPPWPGSSCRGQGQRCVFSLRYQRHTHLGLRVSLGLTVTHIYTTKGYFVCCYVFLSVYFFFLRKRF